MNVRFFRFPDVLTRSIGRLRTALRLRESEAPAFDERPFFPPPVDPPAPVSTEPLPIDELAAYLMLSPKTPYAIRPVGDFVCPNAEPRAQVLALIDHLFVRYPVPLFLYRAMLSPEGLRLVFPGEIPTYGRKSRMQREAPYRRWFRTVSQGDSFALAVRELLTKREAHWFLQAPAHHGIETNLVWARLAALGLPPEGCDFLIARLGDFLRFPLDEQMRDVLWFYVRTWTDIPPSEREEIADFVRSTIVGGPLSFAGRTARSVRKLSDDWHRQSYGFPSEKFVSWKPAFKDWERSLGSTLIRATDLANNRELDEEGMRQRHCVATYAEDCRRGRTRIVSLRWQVAEGEEPWESNRLTLEVNVRKRAVVQIRGKLNRLATAEEMEVVRAWTHAQRLSVATEE